MFRTEFPASNTLPTHESIAVGFGLGALRDSGQWICRRDCAERVWLAERKGAMLARGLR